MGGTLPLLAAWLHQFSADAGPPFGAVLFGEQSRRGVGRGAGRIFPGAAFGMVATIQITAMVNVVIGVSAILLNQSGWLAWAGSNRRNPTALPPRRSARLAGNVALGGDDRGDDRRRFRWGWKCWRRGRWR